MLIGTCYLIQGLALMYIYKNINNNKHTRTIGKTLITISIINYVCSILVFITKFVFIKSIASLSIIFGLLSLLKISKEMKKEQEQKNLIRASIEIIEKLSQ